MRIAILNDTHCGVRNSSDIFITYQERFYEEVFFPYLLENDIKHIIHLGDYYENRKFINFKALKANRIMFLEKLRKFGITMDIIAGNHDLFYKNTSNLCALNELLGHYMNEVNIVHKPKVMDYDGMKMALVPWINASNEEESFKFLDTCKADIVGAHLELAGFEVSPGRAMVGGMGIEHLSRFEMVLSGHYHTKSSQNGIYYLGSQMEFSWNDAHDPKYFHVLNTEDRSLEHIINPITLFEKIYYDDTTSPPDHYFNCDIDHLDDKFVKLIVVNKSSTYQFDQFVDRIQNRRIHELKIAENFEEFKGSAVDDEGLLVEDTSSLLDSYIDGVATDLDKDRIKQQVHQLMIEAQSTEIA
jgi:DNA repair exonuclease SbcCD nuclease subunit